MVSKNLRKIIFLFVAAFTCFGFKVFSGITGWPLDSSTTAGRKVFITLTASGKTMTNNLPATDALFSSGSTLTEAQLLQSVINDFNSIQRSFLILALDTDSDYAANSTNRRIEIEKGTAAGLSSGEAQLTYSDRTITGCKIVLTDKSYENAQTYIALISHELGHCVGLDHPQETVWAVMSYFYQSDVYRLALDDKMGIVHLYPKDSADAQEKQTLGLSCARQ